jgi:hypothetical protein
MRGYCEACAEVVDSVRDDYGGDVCPHCDGDVHSGVHIEGELPELVMEDVDFDEWLLPE